MSSRRTLRAAEAIREVVSMAILTEMKDPRVEHVTVTAVEVAADMRTAKVHVSIMGDATRERLVLAGLRSAAGFLQSRIRDRIDTRYTPKLEFELDSGVKKSIEVAKILSQVLPAETDTPQAEAIDEDEKEGAEASWEETEAAGDEAASAAEAPPALEPPSTRPPAFRPGGWGLGQRGSP